MTARNAVNQELIDINCWRRNRIAIGICRRKRLAKNISVTAAATATCITRIILPGDHKAVTVRRHRRLVLAAARIGVH